MKKRIDWIDIVRAMGMFLIIMGHTLEGYTYSIVGKLIFAVHVPVFFVLSGYLYKEKPVKKEFKIIPRTDQAPVLEYKEGKMAVSAVAGAGKTTIMLALILKLLNEKVAGGNPAKDDEIRIVLYEISL